MAIPDSDPNLIVDEMNKAIEISPDRAEPYFYLGTYLNKIGNHELAYDYLKKAKDISLKYAQSKYLLFVTSNCYGKYVNDELSVACFWTNRVEEGVKLINQIINDPDFEHAKPRLIDNLNHFKNLEARLQDA
jgi:tetratricopeptide (TPR) repeat protein